MILGMVQPFATPTSTAIKKVRQTAAIVIDRQKDMINATIAIKMMN